MPDLSLSETLLPVVTSGPAAVQVTIIWPGHKLELLMPSGEFERLRHEWREGITFGEYVAGWRTPEGRLDQLISLRLDHIAGLLISGAL